MRNLLKKLFCISVSLLMLLSYSIAAGAQQIAPKMELTDIERIISKHKRFQKMG